ncbi:hypothetical protein [Polaribacter sp. R77954]|uniref:hypothetical protein n=1 Tax=Polaribacter sp. R77954 TaxID=3093870 RepID=UPI0037C75DC2
MFSTKNDDLEDDDFDLSLNSPTSWQYGISVGYSYTIRDKIYDNLQLLPISAVVRMYYLSFFSLGMAAGYDVDLKSDPENSGMFGEATLGIGVPQGSFFFAVKGNIFDKNTPLSSTMSIGLRLLLVKQK